MATPAAPAPAAAPTTGALTPSDVVYLCADAFAPARAKGTAVLRAPGTHVDTDPLAHAMLAAAVLGAERAGALRLELGVQKRWFGLAKAPVLFLVPTGAGARWPDDALERAVVDAAAARAPKEKHDAARVLEAVVRADETPAWAALVDRQRALIARGLVDETVSKEKVLGVFTTTTHQHALSDAGHAAVAAADVAGVQRLLAESARTRAEVHARLTAAVREGISRSVRSSSDHDHGSDASSSD